MPAGSPGRPGGGSGPALRHRAAPRLGHGTSRMTDVPPRAATASSPTRSSSRATPRRRWGRSVIAPSSMAASLTPSRRCWRVSAPTGAPPSVASHPRGEEVRRGANSSARQLGGGGDGVGVELCAGALAHGQERGEVRGRARSPSTTRMPVAVVAIPPTRGRWGRASEYAGGGPVGDCARAAGGGPALARGGAAAAIDDACRGLGSSTWSATGSTGGWSSASTGPRTPSSPATRRPRPPSPWPGRAGVAGWFPLGGELTSGVPDGKEGLYWGRAGPGPPTGRRRDPAHGQPVPGRSPA